MSQDTPLVTKKPSITPDGTTPSIAITNLDVRPVIRENQDLVKWRNYTRNAEASIPRRAMLYSLYWDVMLDAQVISVTQKRIDAVTTANWLFVDKDGAPVPEVNALIDSLGFGDLLEEIMNSRFWGYSMIDCKIFKDDENVWQMTADQFDRRHMRPETGMVAIRQNTDEGFSIREGHFAQTVVEAGKIKDLGLLLSAAQYAILKRGGVSDWATFVEVFGQPIMDAEWDGFDEDQRLKLLQAIEEMGNNARLVRPAGTKVQFVPNQNNANGGLQNTFVEFLDQQIAKALLGSTETSGTSERTGYAIGKVHADQDEKKNESDIQFVRRILNSRFKKVLKAFGLPCEGCRFIVPKDEPVYSPSDMMAAFVAMFQQLGMPIDYDYIYKKVGMPKPADFDAQKAKIDARIQQTQETDDDDENENAITPGAKKQKGGKNKPSKNKKPGNVKLSMREKLALHIMDFFA